MRNMHYLVGEQRRWALSLLGIHVIMKCCQLLQEEQQSRRQQRAGSCQGQSGRCKTMPLLTRSGDTS